MALEFSRRTRRPLVSWHDLTPRQQRDLDWMSVFDQHDPVCFTYRGRAYHLGEFERRLDMLPRWHGARCDSFFSGVACFVHADSDTVSVATFYVREDPA